MNEQLPDSYTSFDAYRRIASGSLLANTLAAKRALESGAAGPVLIFDDATGRSIDVDMRGSDNEVAARLTATAPGTPDQKSLQTPASADPILPDSASGETRGRGRPKLGVVPREVTLLPRHWEWLASQPGGASVALRKLVEEARRAASSKDKTRNAHERAYHFMLAIAGNLPGFEEATRALFADDKLRFAKLTDSWPHDVREHANRLAFNDTLAEQY